MNVQVLVWAHKCKFHTHKKVVKALKNLPVNRSHFEAIKSAVNAAMLTPWVKPRYFTVYF